MNSAMSDVEVDPREYGHDKRAEEARRREKNLRDVVNVRVTNKEKKRLFQDAKKAGLTVSDLCRRHLLGLELKPHEALVEFNELRRLLGFLKKVHTESGGAYSEKTKEAIELILLRLNQLKTAP